MSKANNKKNKPSFPRAAIGVSGGRPLTARDVAELCGVELKTVHNWVLEGRLPHFRTPGRHLRFQPDSVRAFLQECGYGEPAGRAKKAVVCTTPRATRALRESLSGVDCTWTPDVWRALIELGRRDAMIWVIAMGSKQDPSLDPALRAVKHALPKTKIVIISDHGRGARRGVTWSRIEELASQLR